MRRVLLALLVCAVAAPSFAADKTKSDPEFKTLVTQLETAWSTLNPDNVASFYSKDATLAFFDIAPLKYAGWTAYDQGVRGVFAGFESLQLTVNDDLQSTRRGNVAWTTGTVHVKVTPKGGSPMEMDTRQTLIWEKKGGSWVVVHEHLSAPMPEEAMKAENVQK
jgi:ketosteroid isomerase-like protein